MTSRRSAAARQPLLVSVRRSALLEDANTALAGVGPDIRRPLRVSFISEHGYEEAGVDQGGLTKEFLEEARCPPDDVSDSKAQVADAVHALQDKHGIMGLQIEKPRVPIEIGTEHRHAYVQHYQPLRSSRSWGFETVPIVLSLRSST